MIEGLIVGVALVAVAFCVWQGVARHRSRRREHGLSVAWAKELRRRLDAQDREAEERWREYGRALGIKMPPYPGKRS